MNDLRKWYNDTFLNAMCLSYYKPKPSSVDDQNTVFSNFHLVGYARMRLQGEIGKHILTLLYFLNYQTDRIISLRSQFCH